ncbi:hypothetical protein QBC39DRAFT_348325 [Podospora conica]|nr:hypothetical protein QBC39DRAFT_348325 [Schizothecium conicum]
MASCSCVNLGLGSLPSPPLRIQTLSSISLSSTPAPLPPQSHLLEQRVDHPTERIGHASHRQPPVNPHEDESQHPDHRRNKVGVGPRRARQVMVQVNDFPEDCPGLGDLLVAVAALGRHGSGPGAALAAPGPLWDGGREEGSVEAHDGGSWRDGWILGDHVMADVRERVGRQCLRVAVIGGWGLCCGISLPAERMAAAWMVGVPCGGCAQRRYFGWLVE